jgi:tRNA 2-thiocytidine biosynthesis protein TtcA
MNAIWTDTDADTDVLDAPAITGADAVNKKIKIEREIHKLEKRLCRQVGQAIIDFNMIEEGDRVMVCVSGGKDSYGLLDILLKLQKRAPINFEIVAVNLDQKQPGFPAHILPEYLAKRGIEFHIETQDTYSIVK